MENIKRSIRQLAVISWVFCLVALICAQPAHGQVPASTGPALQERHPRYVLQRDDVLAISFPLSPELNQSVTVQPDGYVNLQNCGSVYAQGLTTPELVGVIKKAYAGILHEPIVNVDLVDFQKPYFTVSGQVGKPGQYELRSDLTVAEALSIAGGMQATGKQQVFLLRRTADNSGYDVRKVNVGKVLTGKDTTEISTLKPGDMIYVPEKFITNFRKYLPYSANAGSYVQSTPF